MRRIDLFLLLAITGLTGCSRQLPPGQVAAWQPGQPMAGAPLTLYYDPAAPGAILAAEAGLTAELLIVCAPQLPVRAELPMTIKNGVWRARHLLPAEGTVLPAALLLGGKRG